MSVYLHKEIWKSRLEALFKLFKVLKMPLLEIELDEQEMRAMEAYAEEKNITLHQALNNVVTAGAIALVEGASPITRITNNLVSEFSQG